MYVCIYVSMYVCVCVCLNGPWPWGPFIFSSGDGSGGLQTSPCTPAVQPCAQVNGRVTVCVRLTDWLEKCRTECNAATMRSTTKKNPTVRMEGDLIWDNLVGKYELAWKSSIITFNGMTWYWWSKEDNCIWVSPFVCLLLMTLDFWRSVEWPQCAFLYFSCLPPVLTFISFLVFQCWCVNAYNTRCALL